MTTEDTNDNDPFLAVIAELHESFTARGWEGPYYTPPNLSGHGDWELSMGKRDEPHSRNPMMITNVFARHRYTVDQVKGITVDQLAYDLAIAVAGRSAHEALEWCCFQGKTVIDPHDRDVIGVAAESVRLRLSLVN